MVLKQRAELYDLEGHDSSDDRVLLFFVCFENHLLCEWFRGASSVVLKRPPKIDRMMMVSRPHHNQN